MGLDDGETGTGMEARVGGGGWCARTCVLSCTSSQILECLDLMLAFTPNEMGNQWRVLSGEET